MFNYEDILSQMKKTGMSPEEMAENFTAALNKAIKAQEEEAKEEKKIAELRADATYTLEVYTNFIKKWYPNLNIEDSMNVDTLLDTLELLSSLDVKVKNFDNGIKATFKSNTPSKDADKILHDFLKSFNL